MTARPADQESPGPPAEAADSAGIDVGMDPAAAAHDAGLRYVADTTPGIQRRRAGRGFRYIGPDGDAITDRATLARIKALVIPPAWRDVWICPQPNGHIQATGRDDRGRKQYLYHERWREVRDETKYARLGAFATCLPAIRKRTTADLSQPGLSREKVLAVVVQLLDLTLIRVGNEEYARANESYGLTTMRQDQVEVDGSQIQFEFAGKSGKHHAVTLRDPRLARIVRRCEELPGHELFQYVDESGERHGVESADVNRYLEEITGQHFTAKDFRTWGGTVLAARSLQEIGPAATKTESRRNVVEAVKAAARELGNTPAVCRKSYIHPDVLAAYTEGRLPSSLGARAAADAPSGGGRQWLRAEERALLNMLTRDRQRVEASSG